jgi:hypothetical protein
MGNFSYNTPVGQQGSTTVGGGGGLPLSGFRSVLDARIAMGKAKTPEAQYPDGYLGSVIDRRQDKLMQTVRNNARSYTRGVHKGSLIGSESYFWTDDFNLFTSIEQRMANPNGPKWTAPGNPIERLVHGGKHMPREEAKKLARELNIVSDPQLSPVDPALKEFHRTINGPTWK